MCNKEIRNAITRSGLRYWRVADALGIQDGTFSRKLRKELPPDEKKKLLKVIEDLKENDA